jgi:hypothetical protein
MAIKPKKTEQSSRNRSNVTAASAKEAAYGSKETVYGKGQKPAKGSESYEFGDKKTRNTKFYSSQSDANTAQMASTLKGLGKAKEKNLTNKEARYATEDPKAKGKDFSKVTVSRVNEEAYNRVMKRAQASGLSAKDAKKAIDAAIRTTSAGLKSDRDKVAMRAKMQESNKKKKAQEKLKRGY